jgi:hypothetical protein
MIKQIAAVLFFAVGTAVASVPLVLRLGWIAAIGGLILGPALGVMAGVLWASSGTVGGNVVPATEAPPPQPA